MLQFLKDDFICENCGPTPEYIVADGKRCGPTKQKVAHLSEFDRADGDESALIQGSDFNSRVFLPRRPERKAVCELLTNSITQEEFLQSDELQSQNSQMLKNLIERLQESWPDEIPSEYSRLIGNICKPTSVASFMQVTEATTLQYLKEFCRSQLDLRRIVNKDKLEQISRELPALWPNLVDIMNLESARFLPGDISVIVEKLIDIRIETFANATERRNEDYFPWPNPSIEHPTQ